MLSLDKDMVVFDTETTGTNTQQDRIIQIGMKRFGKAAGEFSSLIKPGIKIPKENSDVHHITDEMVATAPPFIEVWSDIMGLLAGTEKGECYIVGYNARFDIEMLWEELNRVGQKWNPRMDCVIDPGVIFKKHEERTLEAAVKFYCGREMEGAHDAMNDVNETINVLAAQMKCYDDLKGKSSTELALASRYDEAVPLDVHGKIGLRKDGEYIYLFGQNTKGTLIRTNQSFAAWMLSKDFSSNTKDVLNMVLREIYAEEKEGLFDEPA